MHYNYNQATSTLFILFIIIGLVCEILISNQKQYWWGRTLATSADNAMLSNVPFIQTTKTKCGLVNNCQYVGNKEMLFFCII